MINNTGQTLIFSVRKGSVIKHTYVSNGSTFIMTSIPAANQGFYGTWNSTYASYNPDEFFIRRQSNASMVYRQVGNGNVLTAMNRPFFVENQWAASDSTYAVGNNRIVEYTYTISSSDIQ